MVKMYFPTVFPAILLVFIIETHFQVQCIAEKAAIFNINTLEVIHARAPPLYKQISELDPVTVVNTGNGIDVYLNINDKKNCIRGGILGKDEYIAYQISFSYNTSIHGTVGVTFNGKGTPLIAECFWYNSKYGSVLKAATYPDGIVIIREVVRIGASPNPLFPPFEALLNEVQKIGRSTKSFLNVAFSFFYPTDAQTFYYYYKGHYATTFGQVPLRYNLATVIVTALQYTRTICPNQFKAFQSLFTDGQSIIGASLVEFKETKVPVYCVNGIIVNSLLP